MSGITPCASRRKLNNIGILTEKYQGVSSPGHFGEANQVALHCGNEFRLAGAASNRPSTHFAASSAFCQVAGLKRLLQEYIAPVRLVL